MADALRKGGPQALRALARGFVSHPRNAPLREALQADGAFAEALTRELARVVLRIAFVIGAEERGLLSLGSAQPSPRSLSQTNHAERLCRLAQTREGGRNGGLWRRFTALCEALTGAPGHEALRRLRALPCVASSLLRADETVGLAAAHLRNRDLLEAVRALTDASPRRMPSLGVTALGALYESLLSLAPRVDGEQLAHVETPGSLRRLSGSYYTPDALVQCLLDSALEPVIGEALRGQSARTRCGALLALRVCDPAAGAGVFLVGAAHRIAAHLARARAEVEGCAGPTAETDRQALRDVVESCLYGVDADGTAVEICQAGLWLEAGASGLSFETLAARIRVGNSLLGATPSLVAQGMPDEAFTPVEGDDPATCIALRKRNRAERREARVQCKAPPWLSGPTTPRDERHARRVADAWCAAFVLARTEGAEAFAITTRTIHRLLEDADPLTPEQVQAVSAVAARHHFFHWHLAFPEVHRRGGFDCVLGNPPWEHAELKEKEWFAERTPGLARTTTGAQRKARIARLDQSDPATFAAFRLARRRHDELHHFLGASGRYPLCGRGRINLYAVFAEASRALLRTGGRCGCIVPSGIATDDSTKRFFQDVVDTRSLISLYDFENKRGLFPDVAPPQKFCLLTVAREDGAESGARFVYFAQQVDDLADPRRLFILSSDDLALLNPNTRTSPVFRSRHDAELTRAIYRRVPVLSRDAHPGLPAESPWAIRFRQGLFNMTSDSHLFRTLEDLQADGWTLRGNTFVRGDETWLPVYEAKMIHLFDHRYNTFEGVPRASRFHVKASAIALAQKDRPDHVPLPRYWAPAAEVDDRWPGARRWALVFRSITNVSTNRRTGVFSVVPKVGIGNSAPLMISGIDDMRLVAGLYAALTSFAFDFVARQSVGGSNFNFFIVKQLVAPSPDQMRAPRPHIGGDQPLSEWMLARVLELTFTSHDLAPFARDCGWDGPPFRWDEARRFALRCELDAVLMHLFLPADARGAWVPARIADGCPRDESAAELDALRACFPTPRDAVAHIFDSFPIVRDGERAAHGDYRTKRAVLEVYDAMQAAAGGG